MNTAAPQSQYAAFFNKFLNEAEGTHQVPALAGVMQAIMTSLVLVGAERLRS
jgi:hypothetical protein